MGYVPPDAKWFLADLVVALSVENDPRILVHVDTVLVRADSAKNAHQKALELGRRARMSYRNAAGRRVTVRFLGLRDLNVIHDELEHGAELLYRERRVRSLAEAKGLTRPKKDFAVFAPIGPSAGPDYVAGSITRELERALGRPKKTRQARRRRSGSL